MGGSALLERPSNLVRLCGTGTTGCHGWVGRNQTESLRLGYQLHTNGLDEAYTPILLARAQELRALALVKLVLHLASTGHFGRGCCRCRWDRLSV